MKPPGPTMVTEREAVKRERAAYVRGVRDYAACGYTTHATNKATELYPLESYPMSQPRLQCGPSKLHHFAPGEERCQCGEQHVTLVGSPSPVSQPLASEGPETPRKATPLAYDLVLAQSQAAREVEAGTVAVEALSAAETAVLDYIASLGDAEVSELRKACHRLAEALAKRCLDDANRDREAPRDWPAGQTWDQLVGSSHSIMRHRAWTEAGLGVDAMRALLFDEYGSPKPYTGDDDE